MTSQPFFIPAILMLLFCIPLVLGLVPRNRFYGIRTLKTLAEENYWYRANRYGGWVLVLSSLIYLLVAAGFPCPSTGASDTDRWWLHLWTFVAPLIASLLLIRRYIRRL